MRIFARYFIIKYIESYDKSTIRHIIESKF